MKKILLVIIIIQLAGINSQAQFFHNKLRPGLMINYQKTSHFDVIRKGNFGSDAKSFGLAPQVGAFVHPNLLIGARFGVAVESKKQVFGGGQVAKFRTNSFMASPYLRYYYKLGKKSYFFLEGSTAFGVVQGKQDNQSLFRYKTFQAGIHPGFAYMISENISLELLVNGLLYATLKEDGNLNLLYQEVFTVGPSLDGRGTSLSVNFFF